MEKLHSVTAIRGSMAAQEYYTCMMTYALVDSIFQTKIESLLPEQRSQRLLNVERIPKIVDYVINNPRTYVFPAVTISIDGSVSFDEIQSGLGLLSFPINSNVIINDGQHRISAIKELVRLDEKYKEEQISVVIFLDEGLKKSQQIFTDLNKYAYRVTNSISTLYDHRDELSMFTVKLVDVVPFFSKYVDKERDALGKNSGKIYTLNNVKSAVSQMLRDFGNVDKIEFTNDYWIKIDSVIEPWNQLALGIIPKNHFRSEYILAFAIVLKGFGKLGSYFLENNLELEHLEKLKTINWSRTNIVWTDMIIANNKVITSDIAATKLFEYLKNCIFSEEE